MNTTDIAIPALRELPAGRLAVRAEHLHTELTHGRRARLSPRFLPRGRLVAIAGACAFAAAGAAGLVLSSGSGSPRVFYRALTLTSAGTPVASWTTARAGGPTIAGGTASQRALLHSILAATGPDRIERIRLSEAGGVVTLRMAAADTSAETGWEESLVAAAFRDRSAAGGSRAAVSLVNGESSGIIAAGPATALPPAGPGAATDARARFEAAAARIGVPFVALTISRPDGLAVSATLESSHPASFLVHKMPAFLAALGDRESDYDGTYIRLVDASGRTVWLTSTLGRTASGSVGSRPELEGCSPVANWGPTAPPCPA